MITRLLQRKARPTQNMEYWNRRLLLAKGSAAAGDPAPYMFTGDGIWYLRRHAGPGPGSAVSRWFAANIIYFRDLPSQLDGGGVSRSDPLLTAEKSKLSFVDGRLTAGD